MSMEFIITLVLVILALSSFFFRQDKYKADKKYVLIGRLLLGSAAALAIFLSLSNLWK